MKRITVRRKSILRAIHAACVALFLTMSVAARAQEAIPDGPGNVLVTGTSNSAYSFGPTSAPPLASGGTVTVAVGTINTVSSGSNSATYVIQVVVPATVINNGTLSAYNTNNFSGGPAIGLDFTPLTTAGDVTINNTSTGTLTASSYGGSGTAIDVENVQNGSISITNSGLISASAAMNNNETGQASTLSGTYANDSYAQGSISLNNTGTINLGNTSSNNGYGANLITSGSGGISVSNSGTISAPIGLNEGLYGMGLNLTSTGSGAITVANSGAITGSSAYTNGYGINVNSSGSGAVSIQNTGVGTITGSSNNSQSGYAGIGINVTSSGTGAISIINGATVTGTSVTGETFGINAAASGGDVSILNNGTVNNTNDQGGGFSYGIQAAAAGTGAISITNTGMMTASGSGFTANISSSNTGSGNTEITNQGSLSATSDSSAYGIFAQSNAGNLTVVNTGTITANGNASEPQVAGISGESSAGNVTINNSGTISAISHDGFGGSGILGFPSAGFVVNNTGSTTGSNYGIYLPGGGGTVNNSGLASGGNDSIFVGSGSTVNLEGASPVIGLLKGGFDDTSNSQLNFRLVVPTGQLAADKATLDAAIAQYDAAYTTAAGDGANVDSEVVTINGIDYQWEDFGGIFDDLSAGRLYRNTPGFASEGLVLDNLNPNNPQAARILNALGNVPDEGVVNALSELSPKELEVFRNVAFDNNTFNTAQINNHLANLRDGLTGFDSSALTIQDSSMDPTLNQVNSHLLAYNPASTPGLISDSELLFGGIDMKDTKSAEVNTTPVDRWSSFIAGNVILANLSDNTNLQDSNYTTGAVTAGVDYRLDDHFTVGALLAYAHTDADLDNRGSSATVDSYSPGIYASYVDGGWYGNFLGAYTRNAYTEDRNIDIAGLNGDNHGGASGNQGSANLTGGYEFHKSAFKFGPVASLQYVHLAIDSIQEQGPTSLDINSQDQDSLRSLIGFEARFNANVATPLGPMSLTPHVSVSWQHEYLNSSQGITSQFDGAGGGSFSVQTDTPDRDSAFVDVGLDATISKNVTVFVDYEAQAGQSNFFAQSAQGGVRIGF